MSKRILNLFFILALLFLGFPILAHAADNMGETRVGEKHSVYTNLLPEEDYVLLIVRDVAAEDLLAEENLIYIDQLSADKNGSVTFNYPLYAQEVVGILRGAASQQARETTWSLTDDGCLTVYSMEDMRGGSGAANVPWYDQREVIVSAVLQEGVASIEASMFSGCSSLSSVTVPSSVTSIGENAFYGCSKDLVLTVASGSYAERYAAENQISYELMEEHIHTFDDGKITLAASCTVPGIKTYTCSVCGAVRTEGIVAEGHSLTETPAKEASCGEPGNIRYWSCGRCGKYFRNEEGTAEITLESAVLSALGHRFTSYVPNDDATYEADGTETAVCDREGCGAADTRTVAGSKLEDTAAPLVEIQIGVDRWTGFLHKITFEKYFSHTQTVTVSAEDAGIGVDQIFYYLARKELSETEIDTDAIVWREMENPGSFSLNPDDRYIVYVKAVDLLGNTGYYSSDGLVLDATAPVITGIADGEVFCEDVTFTVTDKNIGQVVVDGAEAALSGHSYTIRADNGTHTVTASDKAGNVGSTIAVTVYNGHKWGDGRVTAQASCTEEGIVTYTCLNCGRIRTERIAALGHSFTDYISNGDAACTEDGTKTAICGNGCGETDTKPDAGSAKGHSLQMVAAKEATEQESGNISYWICAACEKMFGDAGGVSEISRGDTVIEAGAKVQAHRDSVITLKPGTAVYTGKAIAVEEAAVTGSKGKVTYTYYTDSGCTKKTTPSGSGAASEGAAPKNAGTYYVKAYVAADGNYNARTSEPVRLVIQKASQPVRIKPALKKYKAAAVRKKAQTLKIRVSGARGKTKYKASKKCIRVTKAGKVTVKKGAPKGTYKITITFAATANYKKMKKTIKIKVK